MNAKEAHKLMLQARTKEDPKLQQSLELIRLAASQGEDKVNLGFVVSSLLASNLHDLGYTINGYSVVGW